MKLVLFSSYSSAVCFDSIFTKITSFWKVAFLLTLKCKIPNCTMRFQIWKSRENYAFLINFFSTFLNWIAALVKVYWHWTISEASWIVIHFFFFFSCPEVKCMLHFHYCISLHIFRCSNILICSFMYADFVIWSSSVSGGIL